MRGLSTAYDAVIGEPRKNGRWRESAVAILDGSACALGAIFRTGITQVGKCADASELATRDGRGVLGADLGDGDRRDRRQPCHTGTSVARGGRTGNGSREAAVATSPYAENARADRNRRPRRSLRQAAEQRRGDPWADDRGHRSRNQYDRAGEKAPHRHARFIYRTLQIGR